MRHGKKVNHLGRTSSHRKAMLANMATSLLKHKRITTTLAKARALRTYVEPLITKAKNDTTHSRRVIFSYLQDKEVITILFREIAEKVANRPGGYTRIIKLNNRAGDNAEMALIELVDYNTVYGSGVEEKKTTRRSRRRSTAKASDTEGTVDVIATEVAEPAVVEQPANADADVAVADSDIVESIPAQEVSETVVEENSDVAPDAPVENSADEASAEEKK